MRCRSCGTTLERSGRDRALRWALILIAVGLSGAIATQLEGPWGYYFAIFYIIAVLLLCMHLYHGLWSMFQSLGISHPRYTPALKRFAAVFAIVVAIGYISIPIATIAHLITPEAATAHAGKVGANATRR